MELVFIALAVVFFALVIFNIHIVPQARAYVIERLGAYSTNLEDRFAF